MTAEKESCPACGALPCDWTNDPWTPPVGDREAVAGKVERLRELLAKATPGPWQTYLPDDGTGAGVIKRVTRDADGSRRTDWPAVCNCNTLPNADNAALIVEAINALPDLLAALSDPVVMRS